MERKKKLQWKGICMIFSVIFSSLILFQISYAADIRVTKSSASQIKIGDILAVTISVNNLESSAANVTVKETITGADPVDPPTLNIVKCPPDARFCVAPPYYSWNVILNPNSIYNITYKIKPSSVGEYAIAPTIVTVTGETFYSNNLNIIVRCIPNGKCEPDKSENLVNCPDDCKNVQNEVPGNGIPWIFIIAIVVIASIILITYFILKNYTIQI